MKSLMTSPRLLRLEIAKLWTRDQSIWSPRQLLAGDGSFFSKSSSLNVKRSTKSRFFMYEEHVGAKLHDEDGPTQILHLSPAELSEKLTVRAPVRGGEDDSYYYWTSPISDVAPGLFQEMKGFENLHAANSNGMLDPRGPSLWMGSSGSATQAHYDVADNVIVQLFGTKRIRCYSPKVASALHVFPDAHPRARKSQVNFDRPDYDAYPNFLTLPDPVIDVTLLPGDALFIPAFWFHHVEADKRKREDLSSSPSPSVSLNMFALSKSMTIAQGIFRDGSRPFINSAAVDPIVALTALSRGLFSGLKLGHKPSEFIKNELLDARYAPLRRNNPKDSDNGDTEERTRRSLTASEMERVDNCIARLLPQFSSLSEGDEDGGIVSVVLCHLLELWAVELVGAHAVADAWEETLHLQ